MKGLKGTSGSDLRSTGEGLGGLMNGRYKFRRSAMLLGGACA